MGTDDNADYNFGWGAPVHEVAVKAFDMAKTAVTVEQYAECVIKGQCTEPNTGGFCNWGKTGQRLHPVNCVDWNQANQYAKFKGARLPSESEWEYAAKSGGKNQKYPWGNEDATCDRAVMYGNGGCGCGTDSTMPVCSKPAGNTRIGGLTADKQLCDMAGNVWQWVQDKFQESYTGSPTDGGAFEGAGSSRVLRGGSFSDGGANLRADLRNYGDPGNHGAYFGLRLARSSR
jgi:iron(II)-dependent oxidoreductase